MDYLGSHNLIDRKQEMNKDGNLPQMLEQITENRKDSEIQANSANQIRDHEGLNKNDKTSPHENGFLTENFTVCQNDSQNTRQFELMNGYKSLVESYTQISQSFSRHASLLRTPDLLDQVQELRRENEKFKIEKMRLMKTVEDLLGESDETSLNTQKNLDFSELEKKYIPEISHEIIDRQNNEITVLRRDIKELNVFRDKFYLIENDRRELKQHLKGLISEKDLVSAEKKMIVERTKKTEDLLEVVQVHRDLLQKKAREMSQLGELQSELLLENLEKRLVVLEKRIGGTEDSGKYKKKYEAIKEDFRKSQIKIKHIEEELAKVRAINKDFELSIKSQASKPCPVVLKKLIRLLHNRHN